VAHHPELDSAITLRYRDVDVSVAPPNSQGFVLLQALALIDRLGIDPDPSGPDAGTIAEIFRVASQDRDRHNADPRRARVLIGTLLEDGHLAAMADAVAQHAREPAPPPPVSTDTIALLAVDCTGLGISLIQSLSDGFGSGILEPRTGIILHNRGADFSLDPDHPNVLAGGKRPAHTLMPVVAHREDELVALAGTMGGGAQPQIDAMTLIRSLALGRSAAEAVAEPRWLVTGMSLRVPDRYVMVEEDVPVPARTSLEAAGFELREMPRLTADAGHAHVIRRREDGTFEAGTDPRADGGVAVR